jgi:hypothetical protein
MVPKVKVSKSEAEFRNSPNEIQVKGMILSLFSLEVGPRGSERESRGTQ